MRCASKSALGSSVARVAMAAMMSIGVSSALGQANPFGERREDRSGGRMARGEFVDSPLGDVLRVVSDLTGWTIIQSPGAVAAQPRVNLWARDLRPEDLLRQVVDLSGLILHRDAGVYKVMTHDEFAQQYGARREVVELDHVSPVEAVSVLTPFVEGFGGVRIAPAESGRRVVLVAPPVLLQEMVTLIESIDVPQAADQIEIVKLDHLEAESLRSDLEPFLLEGSAGRNGGATAGAAPPAGGESGSTVAGEPLLVRLMVQPMLNALVVRGRASDVARTVELIGSLDEPPGRTVVGYQLRNINAANARGAIENLLSGDDAGRSGASGRTNDDNAASGLRIGITEANNRVVVEGTPAEHERVAAIIEALDRPLSGGLGGIRVYRLDNATADEVADVLSAMLEVDDERVGVETDGGGDGSTGGGDGAGASVPVVGVGELPPRVTRAPEINAVVVRASAEEHRVIEAVIEEIDKPRDQVMIEVTLVTVSSSDEFNLGVDIGASIGIDGTDIVGLSTFGIGAADAATGVVTPPSPASFGANLAVLNPDDFTLVLNALETVGDVRVSSRPKVLVQDNSQAEIQQLSEEPFETTSQADATTVTAFGGFVEAGTTLTVTPRVSSGDWLRLEYAVNLSSFLPPTPEQTAALIPPGRFVNTSEGNVRIPSGHMVVLGGLASTFDSRSESSIPILGDIPLLGELFKTREREASRDTLFIFIRPVVLRDRGFADLRSLSNTDILEAGVSRDGAPENPLRLFGEPVWIEGDRP